MQKLIDFAWLIPVLPFAGSLFAGVLLLSFEKTMNRLTKPVSFLLISCVALSTLFSSLLLLRHLSGESLLLNSNLFGFDYIIAIFVTDLSSKLSILTGIIFIIIMTASFYKLQRREGYVRYFVLLGLFCASSFSLVLSGDTLYSLFGNSSLLLDKFSSVYIIFR